MSKKNGVRLLQPPKEYAGLDAREALIIKHDPAIVMSCHAFDEHIKSLRQQYEGCNLASLSPASIQKNITTIQTINSELNQHHAAFKALFQSVVLNQQHREWLHLEALVTNDYLTNKQIVKVPEGRLRWRLGRASEKRHYCDLALLQAENFKHFFDQEPPVTQKMILEFERGRMQLLMLTRQIRNRVAEFTQVSQNLEAIKEIHQTYHQLKDLGI